MTKQHPAAPTRLEFRSADDGYVPLGDLKAGSIITMRLDGYNGQVVMIVTDADADLPMVEIMMLSPREFQRIGRHMLATTPRVDDLFSAGRLSNCPIQRIDVLIDSPMSAFWASGASIDAGFTAFMAGAT